MVGWIESDIVRLGIALIGSMLVSLIAFKLRSLSVSGTISALLMGTSFAYFGQPVWFILLLTFFVTATFWSKFKKRSQRKKTAETYYEKTGRRDGWQVFANGGVAMLLCILNYVVEGVDLLPLGIMVFAIVNADTWATEIGGLSQTKPRHIITGQKVEPGTSGGITLLGTVAALLGAGTIGIIAVLCTDKWQMLYLALASGFIGCMLDSLLGATVQRMYQCSVCAKVIEKSEHCGKLAKRYSGIAWMNNDMVNMLSSIFGAGIVWLVSHFIYIMLV